MSTSQTQPTSYFGLTIPFLDFIGVVPDFAENGKSRICLDLRPEHLNSFLKAIEMLLSLIHI